MDLAHLTPSHHVEYVLTAEFDIDTGPTISHQYPQQIQSDKHLMAELMLPDQIHARNEDWTVFFLYRKTGCQQLEYNILDEFDKERADKFYVLNLVNTKFDSKARRGAVVKSMAIITPHPFFQIFKPLLLLALDDYFDNPDIKYLQNLYQVLNSIDMSQVPIFTSSERLLLASSEYTNLFIEKFETTTTTQSHSINSSISLSDDSKSPKSSFSIKSPTSPNGSSAIVNNSPSLTRRTSVATIQQQPSFYIDLKNQGQRLSSSQARPGQRDSHFYDTTVPYKSMNIPIKIPTDHSLESAGDFSLIRLISLLTSMNQPFQTLHPHLTIYGPHTPPLLVLIFALLTQKRILFIGLNASSKDVAEHVLACCSLASGGGILRSFTTHAFPYTDLSKVDDLLASNGYIAGVKNPAFEHHPDWWDIIVDLEHGTMKISPEIGTSVAPTSHSNHSYRSSTTSSTIMNGIGTNTSNNANPTSSSSFAIPVNSEDIAFVDEIKKMIANHFGETSIRTRCQQYIKRFVRISTNYEEFKYGATNLWPSFHDPTYLVVAGYGYTWGNDQQKVSDFYLYAPVIEGWRASRSYKYYIEDQKVVWPTPPKYVMDYECHLDRLRLQQLSYEESASVFEAVCTHTQDYDDINRLLSATHQNNLFYLCLGLFHRDTSIRVMTVRLLQKIEEHTAGKLYFQSISQFQKLAYKRLVNEINTNLKPFVPQDGVPF